MQKGKLWALGLAMLAVLSGFSWGNGLNLNSLGTRALTMGGAFVGLADDFSAVFWNPAGAAWFKAKTFGFYGTDLIPTSTYKLVVPIAGIGPYTMVDAKTQPKHYLGGMAAYYQPVGEGLVVGLGVYTPSGLGSAWDGPDFSRISNNTAYEWTSKIGLVSISPLIAYKVSDILSLGATLNINYGMFNIKMHAGSTEIPVAPYTFDLGQYEEDMSGWGFGATFGALLRPSETLSLGLTVRTPSTVKFKGEAGISNLGLLGYPATSELEREVTWPLWIAGGVAFRPVPKLLLTGDIQWTQWSKIDALVTDYTDPFWQILMSRGGDDVREMYWSDKAQIRVGAEYALSPSFALRAGYYYDPSPSPDRTMNVLLPSYDFNVITLGVGYATSGLQLDFGIEYLMGKDRSVGLANELAMPGTYTMKLWVPNISISYKF